MRLASKSTIVTGAGRGIGQGIALRFGREGAFVACADLDGDAAIETAQAINDAGGTAIANQVDVSSADDAQRLTSETVAAHGRVDAIVNVAGIGGLANFLDLDQADFDRIMRINLMGTFLCAQAAAREMVAQGSGRIVNISSISGQRAGWGRTAYGTSKAAVIQLTRQMAMELAPHNVTANAIAPGPVDTDLTRADHTPETRAAYGRMVPMGRYGTIDEMTDAAVFLAGDESAYITGHVLNVDGGYLAAGIKFDDLG